MAVFETIAAITAIASIGAGQMAARENRKNIKRQNRIRSAQETRQKLEQVRQQRIAQSRIEQQAASSGTTDTSSARGGFAAVGAKTAGNIGFINQISQMQTDIQKGQERAVGYGATAQSLSAISNLSLQAGEMFPMKTKTTTPKE